MSESGTGPSSSERRVIFAVVPPRIRWGRVYLIVGWIILALGALVSTVPDLVGFAGFCMALGAGLIGVGFILRLALMIELRLIDIERQLKA